MDNAKQESVPFETVDIGKNRTAFITYFKCHKHGNKTYHNLKSCDMSRISQDKCSVRLQQFVHISS